MAFFSIRHVIKHTGINPITLRAWEARHGLIHPSRTEGGHRLYSEEDIKRIKKILFLRNQGHRLRDIPKLLKKYTLKQSDLYQYTIPNLIKSLKSLNAIEVQKELKRLLSDQPIETFADTTLAFILDALKKALWRSSIYFTMERCFFYDQLRFQLQSHLYQSMTPDTPVQINIIGYNAPREISEFYVQIYMLALLCTQYKWSVCVITHIDAFEEILTSCNGQKDKLHIITVGCDDYQLKQCVQVCQDKSLKNILFYHPKLGQMDGRRLDKQYLLPKLFEEMIFYINTHTTRE